MPSGHDEEPLPGGLMHPGGVVRVGDTVRRPARPGREAVWALLGHLEEVGFTEAPRFLGVDGRNRDVLSFIPGQVGIPPFPAWLVDERSTAEAARLLARYHEAVAGFSWEPIEGWSPELADPDGGPIICHDDMCPENVVFRDGRAVGLLDFDFAAPGRPIWDAAMAARMWAPLSHPGRRSGWPDGLDAGHRLGVFARSYGVGAGRAAEFVAVVLDTRRAGIAFVRRQVAAGREAFREAWERRGGDERVSLDDGWLDESRTAIVEAVTRCLDR